MRTKQNETDDNNNPAITPFQRFEDFARKIISVPKAEIDAIDPLVQKREKKRKAKQSK